MSRRYPKNRKKQGGARRALLVFLLTVLILAALVLGTLALLELYEQHSLDSFDASLSRNSEWTVDDGGEVSLPTLATVLPGPTATPSTADAQWVPRATLPPSYLDVESEQPQQVVSEKDFAKLRQTMPDIVGWIRLDDSIIDYPVVQGEDNEYYDRLE